MNVVLLGPPGSGKGTQGALLSTRSGLLRVATGDLLRDAVRVGSELGRQAQQYMDQGLLVPDEVIVGLLEQLLGSPAARNGIIMDGFPRTPVQAEAVDGLLARRGQQVDQVLLFEVADEELLRRIEGRARQEARSDDTREAFQRRLDVYRQQTEPLVQFYRQRSILQPVDAVGSVEQVAERVGAILGI